MFKINYSWGTAHWIVPPAIIGVICILLVAIFIRRVIRCQKTHAPIINLHPHYLVENWDKVKLIGTLVLLFLYPVAMNLLHFLPASIIFIFLFNLLFCGVEKIAMAKSGSKEALKSILLSLIISVVASVLIWFIFGFVFKITLP